MNEHDLPFSKPLVLGIITAIVLLLSSTVSLTNTVIPAAMAQPAAATCDGQTATITGTSRPDSLVGTNGRDVIAALGGNDRVQALGGDDLVSGGAGNDQLDCGAGNDELIDSQGTDAANGGAGIDICVAESEISCDEPDTTPPVLTVPPQGIFHQADSADGAVITFSVSAEDNVDGTASLDENGLTQDSVGGDIAISCDPPSGSEFPIGQTIVKCTAKDAAGNTSTKSFTVSVEDSAPPALNVPKDLTADSTSADGAQVRYTVTAQDNVDGTATLDGNGFTQNSVGGDISIDCTLPPGTTFPVGSTEVECNATDAAGNTATPASFTVTANPPPGPFCFSYEDNSGA